MLRRIKLFHVYNDGILIKRGPFRPCGSEGYNSFVADVMDGYFPSEFRDDHPDGLILQVEDKSSMDYDKEIEFNIDTNKFLRKLPKTVVRDGNIVNVRGDIESILKENSPNTSQLIESAPSSAPDKTQDHIKKSNGPIVIDCRGSNGESKDIDTYNATVQVRWIDGKKALIKMSSKDLVGDIRKEIKVHFGGETCPAFELRTAFPPTLLDDNESLEEAGLSPNGVVVATRLEAK